MLSSIFFLSLFVFSDDICPTGKRVRDRPRQDSVCALLYFFGFGFWVLCGREGTVGVKMFRLKSGVALLPGGMSIPEGSMELY